jgi:hypothetical protein
MMEENLEHWVIARLTKCAKEVQSLSKDLEHTANEIDRVLEEIRQDREAHR